MQTTTYLFFWTLGTMLLYIWYRYWRNELKRQYNSEKLTAGDRLMYIKHVGLIIIGIMGIIIILIRLIIYGNEYHEMWW